MKRITALLLLLISASISLFAQSSNIPFYSQTDFQSASPGATRSGFYGTDNPAALSYLPGVDLSLYMSDRYKNSMTSHWGVFLGSQNAAFSMVEEKTVIGIQKRFNTAVAFGDRTLSGGLAYSWTKTENALLDQNSFVTAGGLYRPFPMLSVGGTYQQETKGKGWNGAAEVAVRPFSTELLTLFGEYALQRMPLLENEVWSAGMVVEPVAGARITGRYFENGAVNVGVQLNLGNAGVSTQSHYDGNGAQAYQSYGVRLGIYEGNILNVFAAPKSKYVGMDLSGSIGYQRFEFFDNTKTLTSILSSLEAVKNDPSVAGIAINTATLGANRELLWEVREKLKEVKAAGKKIFVFVERGNIDLYHFASVADRIVIDPTGNIMLEGYLMGRTYVKGTLEKLGIGFDEWRFFKYKSANEAYSMDKMSEADREQRQAIVDAWYGIARTEISESRSITPAQFDSLVNNRIMLDPAEAKAAGLVDSIGRWEMVKEMVKAETGSDEGWGSFAASQKRGQYKKNMQWGEAPKIAVIYALGVCAMDEGINARSLVKDVEAAVEDDNVKAIVLRVDSPGGDAMASDYIAEALKKAKGKKPVIISQGFVAASGGYWLSMYGDTIVAAPGTITGSIGVIGGWLYNKGAKESLGLSTDFVKAGAHADLGFGFQLPLIGLGVPDRNMTLEERSHVEKMIRGMYGEFVQKVAAGREMSEEAVGQIAQGRVWSGIDGKKNGLVDELGGLETAIDIAKQKAGLANNENVKIVEIPKKGLFNAGAFVPKLFGMETLTAADKTMQMVKFRLENNGKPLPLVPLDDAD
ncbi:MAG: signal peptide peptidase SppA, partial [Bacteroidetes bacterium]|nr:signal peptide peptidase SppA [Bacteroidota bacterium]